MTTAEYIATKHPVNAGEMIISNDGKAYEFLFVVADNKVGVWDYTTDSYREFYAQHVFGIRATI